MPLITLAEVRTLLSITPSDTGRDTLISTLIPFVQKRIVEYCNNSFLVLASQVRGTTVAFIAGTPATITDSDSGFVDAAFASGCDIKVRGSWFNDGTYNVATVAAGVLTLASGEVLTTETAGETITVTRIKWPSDLKLDAAQLINYYLTTRGKLEKDETLPGGYSVTYKSDDEIWQLFNKYRKPYK